MRPSGRGPRDSGGSVPSPSVWHHGGVPPPQRAGDRADAPRGLRLLSLPDGSLSPPVGAHRKPLLVVSIDGVGEKLRLAKLLGRHDTIGLDAAALAINDVAASGADLLFVTCNVAYGMSPDHVDEVTAGVAEACRQARCALLDRSAPESAAFSTPDECDVSVTGVGVVDEEQMLGAARVRIGDTLIALRSSGLHANGYSTVLGALLSNGSPRLYSIIDDLDPPRSLGEELLTPTPVYVDDCRALVEACSVHAFAPITGGGVVGNVSRILPPTIDAVVERSTWVPQPIFDVVARVTRLTAREMERIFNMGVGMVAVVPPDEAEVALSVLGARGVDAWVVGELTAGEGQVHMVGKRPGS